MLSGGRILSILSMAALVLAIGVAGALHINRSSGEPPPEDRPARPEPRYRYAPDGYPQLDLPDGTRETIRSVLNVPTKLAYGEFVWNDQYIPTGGPVWVRVDLKRQLMSVFRGGHEIGTAVILYGVDDKETPIGVFPILQKAQDYHSRTYDAPMPYMLRLTNDGVAIHGSDVREKAATHGCVGVPTEFARRLFGEIELGDRVVILQS